MNDNIYAVISFAVTVINIIFIITAVFYERKRPLQALSWVLALVLLPVVGFVLYMFFGTTYHYKRKRFINKCDRNKKYCRDICTALDFVTYDESRFRENYSSNIKQIIKYNINTSQSSFTDDNSITIFTSAEEKYNDLLRDIAGAKSTIHVSYFIIQNDYIGNKLIKALAAKAEEGLEVRVLFDHGANLIMPFKIFKPITENGGEVLSFFSSTIGNYLRANFRNHRKIVIIDGRIGYIGGINIGDEYLGLKEKISPWRDTHLKLMGSSVYSLQLRFLEDWLYASKKDEDFSDVEKYFAPDCQKANGNTAVQIVPSGPDTKGEEIKHCLIKMINSAENFIYIQTPYFIPDDPFIEALQTAAMSGVEVIVQIPAVPDKYYVYKATMSYVADVINHGVKVYLYPGFLHAKMLVVDDKCCTIGTANIDMRSFSLNFEINSFMYGSEITDRCAQIFKSDLTRCTFLDREKYSRRGFLTKMQEDICRLLSPLL